MSKLELLITSEEYKDKFISHIVHRVKLEPNDMGIAYSEYDAYLESLGEDWVGDPEDDAEECLSYWAE